MKPTKRYRKGNDLKPARPIPECGQKHARGLLGLLTKTTSVNTVGEARMMKMRRAV